jgi:glycosyltransferase involved in cell wall biosynthesis
MTAPLVSIVTPSYQQAAFLEATIRSVLSQTYPRIEYIVIDGGSTDGSVKIIEAFRERIAYWVSEPDAGQADAINKGLARATGKYLGWINSDDLLDREAVAKAVAYLEAHPEADFVYGDVNMGETEQAARRLRGKPTDLRTMLETFEVPIPQQGCLWRREVTERTGGLDVRWQVVLDREFFLRVAESYRLAYLPEVLGFFRLHSASKSVAQQARWLDELPRMYEEFFARAGLPPAVAELRRAGLGSVYVQCAWLALKNRLFGRAASFIALAFARDPAFPFRRGLRVMIGRLVSRVLS